MCPALTKCSHIIEFLCERKEERMMIDEPRRTVTKKSGNFVQRHEWSSASVVQAKCENEIHLHHRQRIHSNQQFFGTVP